MAFLHNIRTVALYEAKILRRSWFFRLFSIGALLIFTFMNIGIYSPVGDEDWELVANPASLPLINLYLLNIGQAIVVIFLAADFLKRDKKVDTNEVLYTRSMSNFEYVMGKTIGILRLFIGLDIIILSIGLLVNIISKNMSVDLMAYLAYLLIIAIPTILFSLGLAFVLMSVIRNQAITFLLLLGIAALNMFWLWHRAGSIFDYMAFGLPVFKSDITGFDNLNLIINQRGLYFFLGLALVLATVLLFKRLPQSRSHTIFSFVFMIVFSGAAAVCGFNTFSIYKKNMDEKNLVTETNRKFEDSSFVRITDALIELDHNEDLINASASLKFKNDNIEAISNYIFSLNPYLIVSGVRASGKDVNFTRTYNILEIDPGRILQPGGSDSITISYSGQIDESFCYPNYTDNPKETPYRIAMVNVNKRQAFLTDDYVLLTPEAHWYPVAGLNFYPSNPARIKIDFTLFSLRVKSKTGLTAISQGKRDFAEGYFSFKPESPLTGMTLAIGNYLSDTLRVDSIDYISHFFPGHDYYKKDLAELRDTLPLLVSGIMRELETNFSTKYPFRTLSLVEVPIQFYSYPRMNTQTRAELQPSMVLLPEKLSTLQNAGFGKQFSRQKKRMARSNQVITDKELQVRLFNSFIRNTFISGTNFRYVNGVVLNEPTRFRLGPSFYFFKNNFYSSEYPVINSVFESHLQKLNSPQGGARQMQGNLSDNDKANLILKNASFREILAMNPGSDTIRAVVTVKGDYLFNLIRSKAGIDEFNKWFLEYVDNNKFKSIDIVKLSADISENFGFDFYPYLNDWFNRKEQPGFLFTDIQASEIIVNDRVRYLVSFTAANYEPVAGIFNISFRTGGPGGGRGGQQMTGMMQGGPGGGGSFTISMQGRGMEASDISKIVLVGPEEAKRINLIIDAQPRAMMINALYALNLPGEITIPLEEIAKAKNKSVPSEDEVVLASLPKFSEIEELIVDNEDEGFDDGNRVVQSPLKRLLGIKNRRNNSYESINFFYAPEYWQPIVQTFYYGKYIRSAVSTRGGTGDRSVKWTTPITDPGYYDIYCYVGKAGGERMVVGMRGTGGQGGQGGAGAPPPPGAPQQGDNIYKDMHYKIYHDEGVEEITVDFENADAGWNNMGRYYLSPDSAKVELTNQSSGRIVLGDAIRWVKVK